MARTVAIGIQRFNEVIENNYFYIDKTGFIKEWWESGDSVTLITRPSRFGKTLTISMLEQFFSIEYAGRSDLFQGLSVWHDKKFQELQGTYPVISLSFANVKEKDFNATKQRIGQLITDLYSKNRFLLETDLLSDEEKHFFRSVTMDMPEVIATISLYKMSDFLHRYYKKNVIILLDEYDTPMQEAYVNGFWEDLVYYIRSLLNSTFKTNPWLERGVMTGITRVSKESIFSDLNNLKVVTTTSDEYGFCFGFTEEEVYNAMDEFGLTNKNEVKMWYDGFIFGNHRDIYNPWSILNFLDTKQLKPYWANTSSNSLVGKLIREGNSDIKQTMEELIAGKSTTIQLDEQIVYNQLDDNETAIWSLLLASGYLRVKELRIGRNEYGEWEQTYELELTNFEVKLMFEKLIQGWFMSSRGNYNGFIKALLADDTESMNAYMNELTLAVFSYFDTGKQPGKREDPERFYHGFVLGLMVELRGRYLITSNRESGFGRYDVMLEPTQPQDDAIIIEFKVFNQKKEATLEDTLANAHEQLEKRKYETVLIEKGICENRIHKYGFAFKGKEVLIG